MTKQLPARPSLDWLKKTAKQSLLDLRTQDPQAKLADAQRALAREYGFSSWRELKGNVECLQELAGTSPAEDKEICEFFGHVGAGHRDQVKQLLAQHPEWVHAVGPHPYWGGRPQALHVAIETNRRDMFDLLIDAGADINGKNAGYFPWSPLALSTRRDEVDMRDILIARGASIGLFEALLLGDDARVEKFLRRGKSALPKQSPNEGSILAFARTPFAIDRLLALGASVDKKDRWGATPIETMSRLGPEGQPLVRHMLSKGIDAEPQEYARLGDRSSLAKLIKANPQVAKLDAVFMGAVDFKHYDLVEWLLTQGANVNSRAPAHSNQTALHSAAWNGDLRMAKMLVEAGADIHAIDDEHKGKPSGWAEVSIEITNDPKCREVMEYLRDLEATPGGAEGR